MSDTVAMGAHAREQMARHGLDGWTLVWDNTRKRGGQCRYGPREIGLSGPLFSAWTDAQCLDKIAHEIAHALTPGHGHDAVWRAKCIELGGTGDARYGSLGEARLPSRWVGTCPGGHPHHTDRAPSHTVTCSACSPEFDRRYAVTWQRRNQPQA